MKPNFTHRMVHDDHPTTLPSTRFAPMTTLPRSERITQNRVAKLFSEALGYTHLGEWSKRENNRNIERGLLEANLEKRGYTPEQISAAIQKLTTAADATGITLYQANLHTYQLLRYGVQVQTAIGADHVTVHLIDWEHPENNDFQLAEEVTLRGGYERRPDVVLFINGIAIVVIELKRSSVDVSAGVRQLITNQEEIFNLGFFSTVQLVISGNDSQGLLYGTTGTPEKFFTDWKEPGDHSAEGAFLDGPLSALCNKVRLLDIIRHCIIFDGGQKKVPRKHQYMGFKASIARLRKREGGVIWHTQGSGKSILMIMIAKWLLENDPDGRVLIITDRDELDRQIEQVMRNAGVIPADAASPRVTSRKEFESKLTASLPRLMCALIHKFEQDLKGPTPPVHGCFYVFVDECHRTQGGDMNRQMKRWLESGIFIGFTGTPLLRQDRQTTREVSGSFIHTYKFHEAVSDKVVLDLKYEAREVPQKIVVAESIDEWFSEKTAGLNNYQRSILRKRWANMGELMSSQERKSRIIASIIHDFGVRPRLNNDRGTAMLVAASIYDACHYFRLFQQTDFGRHVGIITSYEPNPSSITMEPPGSDERYKFDTYTKHVLTKGQATKDYEIEAKRRFIEEPANTKLLIVVSKLLTGFDAPSCTYIYLDNEMRDHTLFQAICRTNRLDGDDKDFGHIVDFKELFENVQDSIAVYTSDQIDTETCGDDANVVLKDWLKEGRKKLDEAREALQHLCEPVAPPRQTEQFLRYFCGDSADEMALSDTEPLRIAFYKSSAALLRAYGEIAQNLHEAGYTWEQIAELKEETTFYTEIRAAIKHHAGEELDVKPYEADMRHLINTYIQADPAHDLGMLESLSLTELIVASGINDAIAQKLNQKGKLSKNSVAEGIINNVRKTIIRDQLTDPKFYAEMSRLLEDLIKQLREGTATYQKFLKKAEELARKLVKKESGNHPPALTGNHEAIVIFNNLATLPHRTFECTEDVDAKAALALATDHAMRNEAPAGWKEDIEGPRGREVRNVLFRLLGKDREATLALFDIIRHQPGYH